MPIGSNTIIWSSDGTVSVVAGITTDTYVVTSDGVTVNGVSKDILSLRTLSKVYKGLSTAANTMEPTYGVGNSFTGIVNLYICEEAAPHTDLSSLFTDIANAIRTKSGGSTAIVADNFPTEIANIPVLDTSDATATAEDIAAPKTAYVNGVKVTGTGNSGGDVSNIVIDSTSRAAYKQTHTIALTHTGTRHFIVQAAGIDSRYESNAICANYMTINGADATNSCLLNPISINDGTACVVFMLKISKNGSVYDIYGHDGILFLSGVTQLVIKAKSSIIGSTFNVGVSSFIVE